MKIKKDTKKAKTSKIENMEQPTGLVNERGFPEPLESTCFRCNRSFLVKYNSGIGMYTQKNYGLYGTDENGDYKKMRRKPESERGKKLCDFCLKKFYLENKKEFLNSVKNKSRRQTLRSYLYHFVI